MKSLNTTRTFLTAAILSFAFMSATITANADDHKNNGGHKNNHRIEYNKGEHYRSHNNGRGNSNKESKKYYKEDKYDHNYRTYNHDKRAYYDHPKYGRVYNRFKNEPYVFRHSHGDYYYSDNRFYTYHDGIGYCISETPRNIYFRELPFHCTRVYSNGREYYRNGDLFFRMSARGYVIVPTPVEFNISVRF